MGWFWRANCCACRCRPSTGTQETVGSVRATLLGVAEWPAFFIIRLSPLDRRQHNIPVGNPAVIALEIDRPGQLLVTVDGATGNPRNFPIFDNGLPVLHHRDMPPQQRDV